MEPVDEFVGFEKDRVLHVAADLDTDRAVGILHRRYPIDLLDPVVRRLVEDQAGNPTIVSEARHHDGAGSALDIKFPVEEFRTEATGRHEDSIGRDRTKRAGEFEAAVATFDGSHGVVDHRAPCEFGEAGLCGDESSRVDVAGRRSLERDVEPALDRHTRFAPHPIRVDEVGVAPPVLGSVDPVGGVGI